MLMSYSPKHIECEKTQMFIYKKNYMGYLSEVLVWVPADLETGLEYLINY
jgi:hypothetical protein